MESLLANWLVGADGLFKMWQLLLLLVLIALIVFWVMYRRRQM